MNHIAIMGFGVVGSGVAEVIYGNRETIAKNCGDNIDVKYILDLRKFPDSPYADKVTDDFEKIISDPEVTIVVETMGGMKPAYEFTKRCLSAKKSVVTSNKELVAERGAELLAIAANNGVNYFFEASVGGGIPIIKPLHTCLASNKIVKVRGILNGTTNFILTKMVHENMSFDEALSLAQKLGYAEKDPSSDIDGIDAQRKICILSSIIYGFHLYPKNVHAEGIRNIQLRDALIAHKNSYEIKLIASVEKIGDCISSAVYPALIPHENIMSQVSDSFNAINVHGNAVGDVVFYGRGAGKLPTASAVVADVIDAVRHRGKCSSLIWHDSTPANTIVPYGESRSQHYLRVRKSAGDIQKCSVAFNTVTLLETNENDDDIAIICSEMTENEFEQKCLSLSKLGVAILARLRVID